MPDDDDERSGHALWDLWQMLHHLRQLLLDGFVLPAEDLSDWEDTVPMVRPPAADDDG